jgi:hypothetical protein
MLKFGKDISPKCPLLLKQLITENVTVYMRYQNKFLALKNIYFLIFRTAYSISQFSFEAHLLQDFKITGTLKNLCLGLIFFLL